jgi:putative ABC transport system ATP-binding protein
MQNIVRLKNVYKIYQLGKVEVPALRGIDLEVKKGERFAISGPSGCGKSTLLNLIGCLDRPTKGKVFIDGRDVSKFSDNKLANTRGEKIGFVFQFFHLMPNLTALSNVTLPMIFAGVPRSEQEKRAKKLLEIVGLKKRMNHRPSELSGGERQRIAIARAMANSPEIILADEPTGNLDSKSGKEIIGTLLKLNKENNITLIMVSHDPYIAKKAQRIIYLKDGKIVKERRK